MPCLQFTQTDNFRCQTANQVITLFQSYIFKKGKKDLNVKKSTDTKENKTDF